PCGYRVRILRGKIIHKEFARRILPASVICRKKNGFFSPTRKWFTAAIRRIGDILLDPTSQFSSYFDLAEVERILKEHAAGIDREQHIFLLLSLYYWIAEYLGTAERREAAVR